MAKILREVYYLDEEEEWENGYYDYVIHYGMNEYHIDVF